MEAVLRDVLKNSLLGLIIVTLVAPASSSGMDASGLNHSSATLNEIFIENAQTSHTPTINEFNKEEIVSEENILANSTPLFDYYSNDNLYRTAATDKDIQTALQDKESRIKDSFRVPWQLRRDFLFWLKIYTMYSSRQVVLYDKLNTEIIYEVLDFNKLYYSSRNRIAYEIVRENEINKVVKNYRIAFNALTGKKTDTRSNNLIKREKKRILRAIKSARKIYNKTYSLKNLAKNFRSQTGQRDYLMLGISKYDPYSKEINEIFEKIGVPSEFSRISLLESSFNHKSESTAGAKGVWQFMPETANKFMLTLDSKRRIDERLSPFKSSVAAARLLKENYDVIKSWPLAMIAYNSGFRSFITKRKNKINWISWTTYLQKRTDGNCALGTAGKAYYPSFLAVLYAEKYRDLFFSIPIKTLNTTTDAKNQIPNVTFKNLYKAQNAIEIAKEEEISLENFLDINPDIRDVRVSIPKGFKYAVLSEETNIDALLPENCQNRTITSQNAPKSFKNKSGI